MQINPSKDTGTQNYMCFRRTRRFGQSSKRLSERTNRKFSWSSVSSV